MGNRVGRTLLLTPSTVFSTRDAVDYHTFPMAVVRHRLDLEANIGIFGNNVGFSPFGCVDVDATVLVSVMHRNDIRLIFATAGKMPVAYAGEYFGDLFIG